MRTFSMLIHIAWRGECFFTQITFERTFTSVNVVMLTKAFLVHKAFSTNRARESFLFIFSVKNVHMNCRPCFRYKFSTYCTWLGFVHPFYVLSYMIFIKWFVIALITLIKFFFCYTSTTFLMISQDPFKRCFKATNITNHFGLLFSDSMVCIDVFTLNRKEKSEFFQSPGNRGCKGL